ncbi:site-specific integrase [Streptomyces sp. NPDC001508]|uniref:tyrosine-type recombinase/integrase n=1 Tax=Streptomyces sp. NPDC001508 TaxID=3154656 RepID=UPI0033310CAE
MADKTTVPVGVRLSTDVEYRPDRPKPCRARVHWAGPATKRRQSLSEGKAGEEETQAWFEPIIEAAQAGLSPSLATVKLADHGEANRELALRGLELKTHDPYVSGWRLRVVPALGRLPVRMITNGVVDRTVQNWTAHEHSRSTVKNTTAVLVRVMEQAVRDGTPPSRSTASTAARIGEVSGCRVGDIDTGQWIWTVRRRTTPAPGALTDKGTKGRRARNVPVIEEIRPLVAQRILSAGPDPDKRLFTGPRGGRISTAVLRDATHWDDVVTKLGHEHLRRHALRHTGPAWFADAGVQVHLLRRIAGHGSLTTTQRSSHPDVHKIHGRRRGPLRTPQRAARPTLPAEPDRHDPLTPVKEHRPPPGPHMIPTWSPKTIKGRLRIPPKPPLICDCLQWGRQDLNLRPLDPSWVVRERRATGRSSRSVSSVLGRVKEFVNSCLRRTTSPPHAPPSTDRREPLQARALLSSRFSWEQASDRMCASRPGNDGDT